MARRCGGCGATLGEKAKFCAECGRPTASAPAPAAPTPAAPAPPAPPPAPRPPEREERAERRQLTVMFCDLVGSTELSSRLDPEDLRELIRVYQDAAQSAIAEFDGHIAQYLGDGVLAYFGFPRAHEDDATRAVLAALGILDRLEAENRHLLRTHGAKIAVRVGIHTGMVVVGAVGSGATEEQLAIGETPNMAARLQGLAQTDTIVISADTARLARTAFELEDLGAVTLKGFAHTKSVFRVLGRRGTHAAPTDDVDAAPLLGRDAELNSLRVLWEQARLGSGCTALIRGDAGVGKSRLVRGLRDLVAGTGARMIEARCSPFAGSTALRPIADLLRSVLNPTGEVGVADIEAALTALGHPRIDNVPFLGGLLGIAVPEHYPQPALTPQARKGRLVALAVELLSAVGVNEPVVLLVEDLHWVDPSTLDVLGALAAATRSRRIFTVLTSRTAPVTAWDTDAEIVLGRLPREAATRLMRHVTDDRALPDEVAEQIITKADGNALFIEELTRMVLEAGIVVEGEDGRLRSATSPLPPLAIPATLQDSLMARLDHLTPARKALVQLCATIGRQVGYELVNEVVSRFASELVGELPTITEGELLLQRGTPPTATFVFRHALIQDAAYSSLLRRKRVTYHSRVADVLLSGFYGAGPEVLAHHLTEAGRYEEAVTQWHAAGRAALGAFGLAEALTTLHRGLALIGHIPDASAALVAEISLRGTLSVPLIFCHGFASPEVRDNCSALLDLCTRAGSRGTQEQLAALWGLWQVNEVSGNYDGARQMGERMLQLAERTGDSGTLVSAHTALGAAYLMPADFSRARRHFELGLAHYDQAAHSHLAMWFGQDVGAMCAAFLTWVHELTGESELARVAAADAMARSRALGQPGTQGFVETVLATWCGLTGDYSAGERHSGVVMRLAAEQGMPHWQAQAGITGGWAAALRGDTGSTELLRRYTQGLMGMGARATMSVYYAAIVETELREGKFEAARTTLQEAMAFVEQTNERLYEAGLWILWGRVAYAELGVEGAGVAVEHFRRAVTVARRQGANGLLAGALRALEPYGLGAI